MIGQQALAERVQTDAPLRVPLEDSEPGQPAQHTLQGALVTINQVCQLSAAAGLVAHQISQSQLRSNKQQVWQNRLIHLAQLVSWSQRVNSHARSFNQGSLFLLSHRRGRLTSVGRNARGYSRYRRRPVPAKV